MSVRSRLQVMGIALCSDIPSPVRCGTFKPKSPSAAPPALTAQGNPLVSCLMVTRGNIDLMRYSLACYRRQSYAHRELVVVTGPDSGEKVRTFLASENDLNVTVFKAPPGLTLGDHRNLAAARARGLILVTWDDDDLSDPTRLEIAVGVLRQTGAAAMFINRLLLWWPRRKIAAISPHRLWEQSIAAWRNHMPIYAAQSRGEDTAIITPFSRTHLVATVDCPFLYVYAITDQNTWGAAHFEALISRSECVFEGDQFDELNELLSDRLPLLKYSELLKQANEVLA